MSEVISLRRARKERQRVQAEAQAAANRVKFGRTKAEKANDAAARDMATKRREQAKLDN